MLHRLGLKPLVERPSRWFGFLTGPRPAVRTVEVLPPSQSDETAGVFLTAAFICLCVIYTLAFQLYEGRDAAEARRSANGLLPFQVLFRDLPSKQQRIFREMQEGVQEAMRSRAVGGEWPAVDSLATGEIPPFAPDVLDKSALAWTQYRDGLVNSYVGAPASGTDMPAFMIFIQEPEPGGGEQPAAGVTDEEHQILPDGTLLHITYWKRARESLRPGLIIDPAIEGWTQIRAASPLQTTETR